MRSIDDAGEGISMSYKIVTQSILIRLGRLIDVELIHKLKYQAFLPLYEKYHDDETRPAAIWRLYYQIFVVNDTFMHYST